MNNQKHILKQRWWALVLVVVGIVLYLWLDVSIFPKKAWEKAESENTIQAYEDFLKRYPEGPLADKARLKMEELYFEDAQKINTIQAYEDFLERYPDGLLPDKARLKIQELYFEEAQTTNTIQAYEEFLKQYPQGAVADKAHLMVEKLYHDRKPAFRHTKTVKIIVNQSYGEAEGVSLPFEDIARRLCQYAGLQVVEAEAEDYDATLKIESKGEAKGASYMWGAGFHYSGAYLSGTISLEIPGIPGYKKSFKGYIKPPDKITFLYPYPSSAPFERAFRQPGSFVTKIVDIMGEVYGINTMVTTLRDEEWHVQNTAVEALGEIRDSRAVEPLIVFLLKHENSAVRRKAAEALGKIGKPAVEPLIAALEDEDKRVRLRAAEALGEIKDSRAVEALIAALNDEDWSVRRSAAKALEKITKQDFGQSHDAWSKWWQKVKKKYQQQ